jgi:hypothetical protein
MALNAKLIIEQREYSVMECEYEFNQSVDVTGRPSDRPRGGVINVVILSPDDSDLSLHEWMRDKDTTHDGKILFLVNKDSVDAIKTVRFEEAYCIRLYEYFNDNNTLPMYTKLSIMAGRILFGKNDDCLFQMVD